MSKVKRAELFIKKLINKVVYYGKPPIYINGVANSIRLNGDEKILFLRQDRIGDLLISLPTISLLKELYPKIKIDILLGNKNKSTIDVLDKSIRKCYIYNKKLFNVLKLILELRKEKYFAVIDLLAKPSITSALLIKCLNTKYKIAFNREYSIYSHIIVDNMKYNHIIERTASVLKAFCIDPSEHNLKININLKSETIKKFISLPILKNNNFKLAFNLSGSSLSRFWGLDNSISFIKAISNYYPDVKIIILSTPDNYKFKDLLLSQTANTSFINSISFEDYASIISLCDALLTPDTSAVHIASAFNVPCIALYNNFRANTGEMPWFPYKAEDFSIEWLTSDMTEIPVSLVMDKFTTIYENYLLKFKSSPNS